MSLQKRVYHVFIHLDLEEEAAHKMHWLHYRRDIYDYVSYEKSLNEDARKNGAALTDAVLDGLSEDIHLRTAVPAKQNQSLPNPARQGQITEGDWKFNLVAEATKGVSQSINYQGIWDLVCFRYRKQSHGCV